jgi:hypothetical protein
MQPGRANVGAAMIAHGAVHPPLQLPKGHVVREAADVQFGVAMTVRIAVIDEHSVSTLASHVGRERACRGAKGLGLSRASPVKARAGRIGNSSNGMGREQGSAAPDRGVDKPDAESP